MKVLSAVLLLVGVLVCYTYGQETCSTFPDPTTGKENLDLEKFVKKTWHEVRTISPKYGGGDCTSVKYERKMKKDPATEVEYVKTTYTQYKEAKKEVATMYLKPKTENNKYADSFEVYQKDDLKEKSDELHYQVLTTDYEKYAVIYECHVDSTTQKKTERMATLSTSAAFEETEKNKIEDLLGLMTPPLNGKEWNTPVITDKAKCSGSIFGLSTVLSAIVAMLLVLRN